jgi:hypothetical protein
MAKDLDLSKQTIITIIKNLVARGLVMQNDVTRHLRATNEIFPKLLNDHKTLEYNKKDNSFTIGIETLPDESRNFTQSGKETLPYNNIYIDTNNTNKIYKDKEAFVNTIESHKDKLGNQYQSFLDYWTEADAKGKMRYQDQKFFDIARRVGTWIKNSKNFEPNTQTKIKLK